MSTQAYLLCNLCNTYHARDIQQLNRHKRRDCEGSSTLTSRFYESEDEEIDYFAPSDYIGGQLSDSDNDGDVADVVNLGPIVYNYSGPCCLNELEALGMEMLKISDENGVPRSFQRELTHSLNNFLSKHLDPETIENLGGRCPVPDTMVRKLKLINKELGLVKIVDVCENGCYLFPQGSTDPSECPYCRSPRFVSQETSRVPKSNAVMSVVSVGAAIAERLFNEDARESFLYRERFERDIHEDGVYHDSFSGKVFREQYTRQGLFEDPRDVALLVVVDGFQPHSKKTTTMAVVCCYIMSIDPAERYKNENVLTLAIIPGPKKPTDLMSFLEPIYAEINELGERGMVVNKDGVELYRCKVHLVCNTSDIPGIAQLMNHDGHMSGHGCRICDSLGITNHHAMCFYEEGELRSFEDLIFGRSDLNMPGISSVITSMRTFSGVPFFGMDEMHMVGRGMGHQIYKMIHYRMNGCYIGTLGYSFAFIANFTGEIIMTKIAMYIHLSRETIPPYFEGCWEGPSGFYRAVDWEDYLSVILPCIVLQFIANPVAKKMIMSLVNGCNWSMKRRISTEDLTVIQSHFDTWHAYLATEMERGYLTSRVFTPNNHYLSHIPYMIKQMGPLRFISCRASERNIKTHTRNIRSASKPSENASNNILKREILQSCGIKESMNEQPHVTYHPDSFYRLDFNDPNGPALWEPASSFITLENGNICAGLNDDVIVKALQTCYSRLGDHVFHVDLENNNVLLAKRLWLRYFVLSSALYRKHVHLDIRADNFVLFETGIYNG